MLTTKPHVLLMICCAAALAGCASIPKAPAGGGGEFRQNNEGYSLLYKLMSDESDVGKIFILKSADDPVKNVVKEIASACQSAKKQMDAFPKKDNHIGFDMTDLPHMEQRSREFQAKEDKKQLLESSGKEFELRLIFTQAQAMDYAKQLCNALLEKEPDAGRKTFLYALRHQCDMFHERLMKLLKV